MAKAPLKYLPRPRIPSNPYPESTATSTPSPATLQLVRATRMAPNGFGGPTPMPRGPTHRTEAHRGSQTPRFSKRRPQERRTR